MRDSAEATAAELRAAVHPLVERIGAALIEAAELTDEDVPLVWRGTVVAGVRLGAGEPEPRPDEGGLTGILADVQREFDDPFDELPRAEKQRAVRLLEE